MMRIWVFIAHLTRFLAHSMACGDGTATTAVKRDQNVPDNMFNPGTCQLPHPEQWQSAPLALFGTFGSPQDLGRAYLFLWPWDGLLETAQLVQNKAILL